MDDDDATPRTAEHHRLHLAGRREADWQRWGTYLPERQWGTVREATSPGGDPWSFTHDMARFRAYRWGEDGLLGWTDRQCRLCFSTVLWNGRDPVLKERLFGLANAEGNHGEDVKELYYYLDATPTHSYARALYKYPQAPFPYEALVRTSRERGYGDSEYELLDTGAFDGDRYFDVTVEYAKAAPDDTLIRITAANRGPDAADLLVLPTLVFRNTWSSPTPEDGTDPRPALRLHAPGTMVAEHAALGRFRLVTVGNGLPAPDALFTGNDTNPRRLDPGYAGPPVFSKDAFDRVLLHGEEGAANPAQEGTKAAFVYRLRIGAGDSVTLRLRLAHEDLVDGPALDRTAFDGWFDRRRREADAFYGTVIAGNCTDDERTVSRQAYAGLLWSKQFYFYVAGHWLRMHGGELDASGDPTSGAAPGDADWPHLFCRDVLSVPDKWEYPWFAAWDLAFHMIPMASLDPAFAKAQLLLLMREWYMHPNGQLPAYEGAFGNVNPPVHAFAVFQVYAISARNTGVKDTDFLERAFQKLMLNFTWWVNRNDADGRNLFGGGFLGLDNIGVFDRNMALPDGVGMHQADATAWMGLFCASMLRIATELAQTRRVYEDVASKFFDHYIGIIDAVNTYGGTGLWDEEEGFYFDQLTRTGEPPRVLKLRSIVGLIPLFGVVSLRREELERMPGFRKRLDWFLANETHLASYVTDAESDDPAAAGARFLSLVPKERLVRVLARVLDEAEFLSGHGIRAMSRFHGAHPYEIELGGKALRVRYTPAESDSDLFGGNSNWRGPVWLPINGLLISALRRYHAVYGGALRVECPAGSGQRVTLGEVADMLSRRCAGLFLPAEGGGRPCHGGERRYAEDPHWRGLVLFHEYFCGDSGRGIGASHQTGWTALAATMIDGLHDGGGALF